LLRQDNADVRLTPKSYEMGLASKERFDRVIRKNSESSAVIKFFKEESIRPEEINPFLNSIGSAAISQKVRMFGILSRPDVSLGDFVRHSSTVRELTKDFLAESLEQAEILMKYEGYIGKEYEMAEKIQRLEEIKLHDDFDYSRLTSISSEAREKLARIRPNTIGQASRISGVNPSDVAILLVYLGR
jgi:tRNA uridine 5-carboxymethylaminomethyl modification enzyme